MTKKKIQLNALKEVLEIRLLERLREGESGVYSPSVSVSISKYPLKRYGIDVSFGCSPQNADKLVASTLDEIDQLKADGPPQVNIDKFRAEDARNRDLSLKTNGFWQAYISGQLQNHDSIEDVTTYPDAVAQVTPESLKEAARKCLSGNNYLRLQLLPENAKP